MSWASDEIGRRLLRTPSIAVAIVLLTACASIGKKFDISKVDQLKPGISTRADAEKLLGPPLAETFVAGDQKLLKWMYSQGTAFGASAANVQILFDSAGIMVRVHHRATVGM